MGISARMGMVGFKRHRENGWVAPISAPYIFSDADVLAVACGSIWEGLE